MIMSALDTFDMVIPDEYNRDALEMLNEIHQGNDKLWDFPSFNSASYLMNNMDMVDDVMGKDQRNANSLYNGTTFVSS